VIFQKIHESRALIRFVEERLPHYGSLISGDMQRFREELIKATAGVAIAAGAGLFCACFLGIALIVSSSPGIRRTTVAWIVCGVWGVIGIVGLVTARRAVAGPPPFHLVGTALVRDYARFVDSLPREPSGP
jgi:hypothetical protein